MAMAVALELAKAAAFAATTLESCPTSRAAATAVEAACSETVSIVTTFHTDHLVLANAQQLCRKQLRALEETHLDLVGFVKGQDGGGVGLSNDLLAAGIILCVGQRLGEGLRCCIPSTTVTP